MNKLKKIYKASAYAVLVEVVIISLLYLCSAYGGFVYPQGNTAIFAVLNLAYLPLLAVMLLHLVVALLMQYWRALAVLVVALIASLPTLTLNIPYGGHVGDAAKIEDPFRLLTFNVRYFGIWDGKKDEAPNPNLKFILDSDADVVVLQEASITEFPYEEIPSFKPLVKEFRKKYPYRFHGYRDVVILSKYPYRVTDPERFSYMTVYAKGAPSSEHHFGKVFDVELPSGRTVRILGLHLQSYGLDSEDKALYRELTKPSQIPGKSEVKQVQSTLWTKLSAAFAVRAREALDLRHFLDNTVTDNVIVCGDFNDTPGSYAYRTIKGEDLRDAYADAAVGPTITYRDNRFYFRIDHVLYGKQLAVTAITRPKQGTSDHYPLLVDFAWKKQSQNNE